MNVEEELFEPGWREPSEEEVRALHAAVLSRVRRRVARQRVWRWYIAGAAAAAAACCAVYVAMKPPTKQTTEMRPVPSIAAMVPPRAPVLIPTPVRFAPRRHHRSAPGLRAVELITKTDQPPVIKLTTTDPNVVILLVSNDDSSAERTLSNE